MHEAAWVCRGLISLLHGCSSRGGADCAEEGALLREHAVSMLRSETCPAAGFDVRANERGWRRRRAQEHLGTSCTRVGVACHGVNGDGGVGPFRCDGGQAGGVVDTAAQQCEHDTDLGRSWPRQDERDPSCALWLDGGRTRALGHLVHTDRRR